MPNNKPNKNPFIIDPNANDPKNYDHNMIDNIKKSNINPSFELKLKDDETVCVDLTELINNLPADIDGRQFEKNINSFMNHLGKSKLVYNKSELNRMLNKQLNQSSFTNIKGQLCTSFINSQFKVICQVHANKTNDPHINYCIKKS